MNPIIASILVCACPTLQTPADEPLALSASTRETGDVGHGVLVVKARVAEGWTLWADPLAPDMEPGVLLRIEAPAGIELVGERPDSMAALLRSGYLENPREHVLGPNELCVPFQASSDEVNQSFALEFVAYLIAPGEEKARLVRRELALAVTPGAEPRALKRDPLAASGRTLRIGDRLPLLTLPRVFGPELSLAELSREHSQQGGFLMVTAYHSCL
jgi:hypothetical protein